MKKFKPNSGFTMVELLVSLMILGILMAAVAVAFDAAVENYTVNEGIAKTMNTARAALMRITTELRTANSVGVIPSDDPDNTQCRFSNAANTAFCYWYDSANQALRLNTDGTLDDNDPVLCRNVTAVTFERSYVAGSSPTAVRNVRIVLTLTDDNGKNSRTLATAAVVRRNL